MSIMAQQSYEEILSIFDEISKNYKRKNQYFDILYDSISFLNIRKTSSEETISIIKDKSGIVARTYTDRWKEFAFDDLSDMDKVKLQIPKVSSQTNNLSIQKGWKINKEVEVEIDPKEISLQQKIEKIRSIFESFKKYDERIINPIIAYSEFLTTRIFVNNEGCQLRQVIPRIRVFIQPIVKEEGTVDFDYHSLGGEIGFEIFKGIENKLENFAQNSLDMLKADKPPSGKYPIILDPDMAGLIAHESFGHGLEADQILRDRSYLKDLLNKQVASKISNIYDAPNISNKYGSYFFDDEGIKAEKN
ncbi:MAG: TldD/PmbA family protein, partial [Promethearchaeota archaeon]